MPEAQFKPEAPRAVVENIEAILRLETAALHARTRGDRLADTIAGFVGTLRFVALHLGVFAAWAVINSGLIPSLVFDPYPFALLTMVVSMEGVLLATFVLIKQNRMSHMSDRRDHLHLQIDLLAEREVTRLLQVTDRIAQRLGMEADAQLRELSQETTIDGLMDHLDEKMSKNP